MALTDRACGRLASRALQRIGVDDFSSFLEALRSDDADRRERAGWALEELRPPADKAFPALVEALKDSSPDVRASAASILGQMGPAARDALPALREAARDRRQFVRRAARAALRKVAEP
jgi:HEAT repeat protein